MNIDIDQPMEPTEEELPPEVSREFLRLELDVEESAASLAIAEVLAGTSIATIEAMLPERMHPRSRQILEGAVAALKSAIEREAEEEGV